LKKKDDFKKKKFLNLTDRICFIGATNKPYLGNPKDFRNYFERKFYFPYLNYASRMLLFRHFVEYKGVKIPEDFSVSTLAHISKGYTAGGFKMAVDRVLSKKRVERID